MEEKVADGTHDVYIDRLGDFLLSLGKRPVFLRIAYEFDGDPWNHYDRETTIVAYKRIVDRLRAKGSRILLMCGNLQDLYRAKNT